jgi:hypothetical protein
MINRRRMATAAAVVGALAIAGPVAGANAATPAGEQPASLVQGAFQAGYDAAQGGFQAGRDALSGVFGTPAPSRTSMLFPATGMLFPAIPNLGPTGPYGPLGAHGPLGGKGQLPSGLNAWNLGPSGPLGPGGQLGGHAAP